MSLRVDRLTYAYGPASPVLTDIVLHLEPGERVAVFGRNGAGKSTLARCLAGWLDARGSVTWEGRSWSERSPADRAGLVQLVDQNPRLQISGRAFTVRDEIAFGPENLCLPRDEIIERVEAALAALDLAGLAHRDPTTLSGGELQRVVLAGALAMRPGLLVLDEPSTDLDAAGCRALAAQLAALPGTTTVVILDTGPHRWLTPLIGRSFRLQATRIESRSVPCRSEGLVLPDGLNAFVEGRAAGLFGDGVPPPDDLRETVDLFRGCLP